MYYEPEDQNKFQQELQRFISVFKQQKLNSDILPFEKQLFSYLNKSVKDQEERIKEYVEPEQDISDTSHMRNLKQLIFKCETEKVGYLLKEYLRMRLRKIEKYCFYLYKNQNIAEKKLSQNEYVFLRRYAQMKYQYFEENILKNIVKPYRGLGGLQTFFSKTKEVQVQVDTKQSKIEVPQPQPNDYYYCQITGNPDLYRFKLDIPISNAEENAVIPINSILYTQYKYIAKLLHDNNAILI